MGTALFYQDEKQREAVFARNYYGFDLKSMESEKEHLVVLTGIKIGRRNMDLEYPYPCPGFRVQSDWLHCVCSNSNYVWDAHKLGSLY